MNAWICATFWCETKYVLRGNVSHYYLPQSYVGYLETDYSEKCLRDISYEGHQHTRLVLGSYNIVTLG